MVVVVIMTIAVVVNGGSNGGDGGDGGLSCVASSSLSLLPSPEPPRSCCASDSPGGEVFAPGVFRGHFFGSCMIDAGVGAASWSLMVM